MNFDDINTTTQGSIGLGIAISHFTIEGYIVLLPLIDNQNYDLVIDKNGKLEKVQVKTTGFKEKDKDIYTVQLKSLRHNKTTNRSIKFDGKSIDWLFIMTEAREKYIIPAIEVDGRYAICLGKKYEKYKVNW